MPDQIDIGAGTSIGYGNDLVPFIVEDGWLQRGGPITIGARRCFIRHERRRHARALKLGDGTCVSEQSLGSPAIK